MASTGVVLLWLTKRPPGRPLLSPRGRPTFGGKKQSDHTAIVFPGKSAVGLFFVYFSPANFIAAVGLVRLAVRRFRGPRTHWWVNFFLILFHGFRYRTHQQSKRCALVCGCVCSSEAVKETPTISSA